MKILSLIFLFFFMSVPTASLDKLDRDILLLESYLKKRAGIKNSFIDNTSFRLIANYFIDVKSSKNKPFSIDRGEIIFLKAELMQMFFLQVHPFVDSQYILITHWTDISAPGNFRHILDDPKLIAWFAQNPSLSHPKLIPIPLGLASTYHATILQQIFDKKNELPKKYLLYLNINVMNNYAQRFAMHAYFKDKSFCYNPPRKDYSNYLMDLAQSKFVLSPTGFGLDCHRTWEALYLDAIPIVKSSSLDSLYEDLPVLIIKDWQQINEDFLNKQWIKMKEKKYSMEKLFTQYWYDTIKVLQKKTEYLHV